MTPDTIDTIQAPAHSKLSPSKAYQWTACTASIGYIAANRDRLPPDRPGPAALEGTAAHTVAECFVLDQPIPSFATRDMRLYGKEYAELCKETMGPKQHLYAWGVEHRVPLYYLPQESGTVDFFCVNRKGIHLIDFKYGYGEVPSIGNKQMAIYAMSLITENAANLDWPHIDAATRVTMTIFQPRIGKAVETWNTTVAELTLFTALEVDSQAQTILGTPHGVMKVHPKNDSLYYEYDTSKLKFSPSETVCKFCPMVFDCEARTEWMLKDSFGDVIQLSNDGEVAVPQVTQLSDEALVKVYRNQDILLTWLKEIASYLQAKVQTTGVPGLKMVLSKGGHRFWEDEKQAGKLLLEMGLAYDEVYSPPEVVTPAQAEKLTKKIKSKKQIELHQLMVKPKGSPVMALESDPRPAHVEKTAEQEFAEVLDWA